MANQATETWIINKSHEKEKKNTNNVQKEDKKENVQTRVRRRQWRIIMKSYTRT